MVDSEFLRTGMKASAYVTQLAIIVAIAAWLGKQLDTQLGTAPWLVLGFSAAGFALGLFVLYRGLQTQEDDPDPDDPSAPDSA